MAKQIPLSEEQIELYHDSSIQEILGKPPAHIVAIGSGVLLVVILGFFLGTLFYSYPDVIRGEALIEGFQPIAIITAPESGWIKEKKLQHWQAVSPQDTVLIIDVHQKEMEIPVMVNFTGFLEIDPVLNISHHVTSGDTIAYIWEKYLPPVVCTMSLSASQAREVHRGDKIRIYLLPHPGESVEFVETEILLITHFNIGNMYEVVTKLPDSVFYPNPYRVIGRENVSVVAEIITKKNNLFNRLINPFRGLAKK